MTDDSSHKNTRSSAEDSAQVLSLHSVVKRFGEKTAVDGLDLHVNRGEVLALLGPNGAGKTTTVELCEGFLSPDAGSVRVFGLDPCVHTDEVRGRIGVMLQGGGAYPGVRVGEMLRLVASYSDNPLDVDWLLETVGMASYIKTPYRRLSGGQQQRLSLACALVGRPELIFLDEPTAGLDAQSRLVVWDLVRSLRRDGVTVVLTTHLMDEAEALADRVVIVDRGTVVAQGTPAELTSSAGQGGAELHQVILQTDSPVDAQQLTNKLSPRLPGFAVSAEEEDPTTVRIEVAEVTPRGVAEIAAAVAEQDVLIRDLNVNKQSLEDIFLFITGREIR
ncbi:ABC transporter ATP-binding protein [Corynebacterium dentalis]|uniref:ABC transporter ATP-binding protein n=1 Tax=Corynebacterium dentalis TaxID=2014528 RepID=UPI0035E3E044